MVPTFPARRWLAAALLICGLDGVHTAGPSPGVPPGSGGGPTTAEARARAWRTHLDLRDASPFRPLHWEPLGPSLQGGRIEAIAAAPGSSTIYVGPGAGNVWKTTNNGMRWEPVFEHESAFAIGDISVAPSDPNIVWVGTGEVQPRHSGPAFSGTGVFKSADAGRTWRHLGLGGTHHIAKIVVDAKNPDIAYVAAMGHFWSPNEERGVFKTVDGGATWTRSLYINDRTGAIDLVMDPSDHRRRGLPFRRQGRDLAPRQHPGPLRRIRHLRLEVLRHPRGAGQRERDLHSRQPDVSLDGRRPDLHADRQDDQAREPDPRHCDAPRSPRTG